MIKKFIIRTTLLLTVAVVAVGGWLGYKLYADAAKVTGDKNPLQLVSAFMPSQLNETNGRVNILLAGYSVDDPGHQGAELTDSIMIVSYNPQAKSVALVSIPRDTLVDIPGFGYQKINAAYEDGQSESFRQSGYASGGMGLLEEVVQQNFGVQSDYYGLLDYAGFSDAVNDVGGVTIDIQSSDPNGLYDPNTNLDLPNGPVTLNGQQALNLARARGDGYGSYGFPDGDFDRTQHQQQLLAAIMTKASSTGVLSNPLKVGELADTLGNNFKTDLSLGDMETLFNDTKHVTANNITTVSLDNYKGQDLFTDYEMDDGEDALVPAAGLDDYSQIQAALQTILN
jgi:LCP family protein required for cell wall assembly